MKSVHFFEDGSAIVNFRDASGNIISLHYTKTEELKVCYQIADRKVTILDDDIKEVRRKMLDNWHKTWE